MQSRGNWVLFITNVMQILNAHVALKCSTDIKRVLLRGPCNCIAESSFDPILLEKGCVSKNKNRVSVSHGVQDFWFQPLIQGGHAVCTVEIENPARHLCGAFVGEIQCMEQVYQLKV